MFPFFLYHLQAVQVLRLEQNCACSCVSSVTINIMLDKTEQVKMLKYLIYLNLYNGTVML